MKQYPLYILDLDGTVYRGKEPTFGAVDTLQRLRQRGAKIRFLTNNSSQTPFDFAVKLMSMGIEALPEEIYSSATGTAQYVSEHNFGTAFVIGEAGLVTTLEKSGIKVTNKALGGGVQPKAPGPADAVVVGICRKFTYDLMHGAMQNILDGATFIATNPDATYPLEGGVLIPGAGSIVAAVWACSGREPFIVGKPNPYLVEQILTDLDMSPVDALVVGDRDDTDLEAGRRAGADVHLVLCGVTEQWRGDVSCSDDLRGLL